VPQPQVGAQDAIDLAHGFTMKKWKLESPKFQ